MDLCKSLKNLIVKRKNGGKTTVEILLFVLDKPDVMHMPLRILLTEPTPGIQVLHRAPQVIIHFLGGKVDKIVDNFNLDSIFS